MQAPESWVTNIQQSGLSVVAAHYLWRGLAPSTRRNYDTPRARFTLFCTLANYHHPHGGCFPALATWLIEWLCSLAGTVKVKTLKLYLTGIKSYQLDLGIDCGAFSDARLERTIQGIKRDHNEPARRTRSPLTRPHLLRLLRHLPQSDYDSIVLRAAFTLAFAGFLRVGECTYRDADKQLNSSFAKWFITKRSIIISEDRTSMDLTLPASKTDPFREGIRLTITASGDEACAVKAMRRLRQADSHRANSAPLFCIGEYRQDSFTREHVVARLQQLALLAGLGQGTWNGHSFRRGAATWAAESGMSESDIQTLGRWRSDSYKVYIKYSRKERIALSKRFQNNQLPNPAR